MPASVLARWFDPVLDLLFPAICPVCETRADEGQQRPFCASCWEALPRWVGPGCAVCGAPAPGLRDAQPCDGCRRDPPPFDFARAAAVYRDGMRAAVLGLKYGRRPALARPLGALLAEAGRRLLPVAVPADLDAVVPVPLHGARRAERGFNQSELLAADCARRLGLSHWPGVLARVRPTPPQTALDAVARRANVAGAFRAASRRVRGQRLLLVDDVFTTGATAAAAASALRAAGAARVGVLVLARVADP